MLVCVALACVCTLYLDVSLHYGSLLSVALLHRLFPCAVCDERSRLLSMLAYVALACVRTLYHYHGVS